MGRIVAKTEVYGAEGECLGTSNRRVFRRGLDGGTTARARRRQKRRALFSDVERQRRKEHALRLKDWHRRTAKAPKPRVPRHWNYLTDPLSGAKGCRSSAVQGDLGYERDTKPSYRGPAPEQTEILHRWDRDPREFPPRGYIDPETIRVSIAEQNKLGLLRDAPNLAAIRCVANLEVQHLVDEFLALGGKVTQCPAKERDYVFSADAALRADKLRKRAERGAKPSEVMSGRIFLDLITKEEARENSKRDAQEELDWLRYRALPGPYEPKGDKRCDPHSIRSNVPFDFEDRFLATLGLQEGELWGDVFYEDYSSDDMDFEEGNEGYKPSASVHDLVRPDYTNSLNRLFGQEVDHRRLNEGTLKGATQAFRKAWNADLKELRREDRKERDAWHALLKCPS